MVRGLTTIKSCLQGEYFNCLPQILLKFSGLQDSGIERYLSSKLVAETHFYFLENSVQFWTKRYLFRHSLKPIIIPCRTPKSSLKTKISRILRHFRPFTRCWQLFVFFLLFCSIFNAVFKVRKMHSGSKFWAWVSFQTTVLKFWKF